MPLARPLTAREREVVTLLGRGLTVKDVASKLNIAVKTAAVHKENIMRKLDLHDRLAIMRWTVREGLVPCPCGLNQIFPALG